MKKRFKSFTSTFGASIALVAGLLFIGLGHAAATPLNCSWTGAGDGATFSDASNWSGCNSAAPTSGDNLIFDDTTLSANTGVNDDISGVTFGNITFQGSNTLYGYNIFSGDNYPLSLSGNITDNATTTSSVSSELDLTSNATITVGADETLELGELDNNSLNIGSNTVTITGNGNVMNSGPIVGTGTLDIDMSTDGYFEQNVASPNFTGTIDLQGGTLDLLSYSSTYPDIFSAAADITVASGTTLYLDDSAASAATISEPLTLAGSGASDGADGQCDRNVSEPLTGSACPTGAIVVGFANSNTVTLAGAVTLASNTQLNDSNGTITINGPLAGGYTVAPQQGGLVVSSSNNTSATPNGTYAGSGGSSSSGSSSTKAAPKTPDTGLALIAAHPAETLEATLVLAGLLVGIALLHRKFVS